MLHMVSLTSCPCRTNVPCRWVGRSRVREGSMHCQLHLLLPRNVDACMHACQCQLQMQHNAWLLHFVTMLHWCAGFLAAHMVQQGRAAVHASTEHAHVLYLHHVQSLPHVVHHVVQFGVHCVVHVDVLVWVSCRRRRGAESVSCRALQRARRKALSMSSARAWLRQLSRATSVHYPSRVIMCIGIHTYMRPLAGWVGAGCWVGGPTYTRPHTRWARDVPVTCGWLLYRP